MAILESLEWPKLHSFFEQSLYLSLLYMYLKKRIKFGFCWIFFRVKMLSHLLLGTWRKDQICIQSTLLLLESGWNKVPRQNMINKSYFYFIRTLQTDTYLIQIIQIFFSSSRKQMLENLKSTDKVVLTIHEGPLFLLSWI